MLVNRKIIQFASTGLISFQFIDGNNKRYLFDIYYSLFNNTLIINNERKANIFL